MTAESKKLQTVDRGGWLAEAETPKLRASQISIVHDARIAHEQRGVLRRVVAHIRVSRCECDEDPGTPSCPRCTILAAAAPFLED